VDILSGGSLKMSPIFRLGQIGILCVIRGHLCRVKIGDRGGHHCTSNQGDGASGGTFDALAMDTVAVRRGEARATERLMYCEGPDSVPARKLHLEWEYRLRG